MADRDTLAALAEELGLALAPLTRALEAEGSFTELMLNLGWDMTSVPAALTALQAPAQTVAELVETGEIDASSAPGLLQAIGSALGAISNLGSATGLPGTVDAAQFVAEFPRQLVDYLAVEYLLDYQPRVGELLKLAGVIRLVEVPAADLRGPFVRRVIAWEDIAKLLDDPASIFRNAYKFGQPDFDQESFIQNVADAAEAFGIETVFDRIAGHIEATLLQGSTVANPYRGFVRVPLLGSRFGDDEVEAGVGVYPLPDAGAGKPPGFAVLPYARGQFQQSIDIAENVSIVLEGSFDAAGGVGILVRPSRPIEVLFDLLSGAPAAGGALGLGVAVHGTEGDPLVLAGSRDASRIEFRSVSLMGGVRTASGALDAFVELGLQGGRIVVKPASGDSDSFLASLLPGDGLVIDLALLVGLSSKQGIYFGGSGGLEISLPAHIQVGPIEIVSATIAIRPKTGVIPLEAGATIKGDLGPLKAIVENVGLRVELSFPAGRDGNLGTANLALGFKPPNGVGLAIDAGTVKGGGYLYFDFDKEEYAGVLELSIAGFLTLTAIGLVTTKMPDGSKGFSLLIIITAEFGTGIQLGFGFTLVGVGGLLGLNRTVKLQPLADGVRTGAVNNIMFPKNVVANAPRIISDLRAIFPPFEGTFLIGPMAKLGWGSPPLITLSLGVIIEIPGNLAILGVLRCVLPDAKAPVLVLQIAFVGAIEFDKKRLWLFAGIFDSKILTFTLEGEMGVLFAWGDQADFVLSVGGFHPRFTPPPLPFPSPKRLAICILDEDQARIRVSTYFAVTTNTVQFGASAELFFGFSAISVEGHFQFDALFQFSPFYFVIELGASVSLKVFGMGVFSISLELALEGPTPWHARGRGSISFFFFDVSANFDETWGEEKDTTLPPIEVFPLLAEELAKEPNWSALSPKSGNLLVSLRVVGESKEFVLHPVGTLRITQRTVPLNSKIDLFGTQKPADANRFALAVKTPGLAVAKVVREEFAPAQFHAMSRNEKLAAPAFSQEDGGVDISATGDALRSSLVVRRIVRYEQIILDTNFKRFQKRFVNFAGSLFHHFLGGNAAARSSLSARLKNQMQPFQETIKTRSEGFGVANTTNNTMVAGTTVFGSYHAAKEHMEQAIAQNPELAGTMHVVPDFEIRRAA